MAELVGRKEKLESTLVKVISIGAGATISDRIVSRFTGNGTIVSGIIKLLTGYFGARATRGIPEYVCTGIAVDGAMDIVHNILGGVGTQTAQNVI